MRISDSLLAQSSAHILSERRERSESLRIHLDSPQADQAPSSASRPSSRDRLDLSDRGRGLDLNTVAVDDEDASLPPELRLIKALLERMLGIKIRLHLASDLGEAEARAADASRQVNQALHPTTGDRVGWGLEYDSTETRTETEMTTFTSRGVVRTADGRELSFDLRLEMQRQYVEQTSLSVRAGDAPMQDPLVVNFGGNAAELTSSEFAFDLDSDGKAEQLPGLGTGHGFLALDTNGNGKIDNGTELFGPATGNGFGELAGYDADGNRWIYESDPVYSQLEVWSPGQPTPISLRAAGVGAISLESIRTPFLLRQSDGQRLGRVVASSVFLTEAGRAGSVQQVDLAG